MMKEWYIIQYRGVKPVATPLYDELRVFFSETDMCWPMHVVTINERRYVRPILPRTIFVRATLDELKEAFAEKAIALHSYAIRKRGSQEVGDYQVVPDEEIQRFRWFVENESDNLVMLHKTYSELQTNMKVRVKHGALKGMEGIVFRHHGDRRFVFNVGNIAIVVPYIQKWNMEVIGDNSKMIEGYSVRNEIDIMQEKLREYVDTEGNTPYYETSDEMLARMVLAKIGEGKQNNKTKTWTADNISKIDEVRKYLGSLDAEGKARLDIIVNHVTVSYQHLLKTPELPEIKHLFCASPLRPFLTLTGAPTTGEVEYVVARHPEFVELVREISVEEEAVAFMRGVHNYYRSSYYAHVALFAQDGGVLAITNWNTCAEACKKMASEENFRLELTKIVGLETDKEKVHFATRGNINGTAIYIPDVEMNNVTSLNDISDVLLPAVDEKVGLLIDTSMEMCKEIWRGTYLGLRQELLNVWIKAVYHDVNVCDLRMDQQDIWEMVLEAINKRRKDKNPVPFSVIEFCNHHLEHNVDARFNGQKNSYRLISKECFELIEGALKRAVGCKRLPNIVSWKRIPESNIKEPVFA